MRSGAGAFGNCGWLQQAKYGGAETVIRLRGRHETPTMSQHSLRFNGQVALLFVSSGLLCFTNDGVFLLGFQIKRFGSMIRVGIITMST